MKQLAIGFGIVVVFAVAIGTLTRDRDPPTAAEKITSSCDAQFGSGTDASARCQLLLAVKAVEADNERRMRAAEAGAR